jgi:hypothetical protein
MIFWIDEVPCGSCIDIPGANASIHVAASADEQTATFSRRFLTCVGDHFGDVLS